nr:MAG TPA: hypothetical protein [Crassvirales sp.]DAJ78524.1 MAG TPA: hypothetical protein [Crassvirales sp.]DAP33925.1 MAG TPA: hypothetical protein [Caudoviricetes sp.]
MKLIPEYLVFQNLSTASLINDNIVSDGSLLSIANVGLISYSLLSTSICISRGLIIHSSYQVVL